MKTFSYLAAGVIATASVSHAVPVKSLIDGPRLFTNVDTKFVDHLTDAAVEPASVELGLALKHESQQRFIEGLNAHFPHKRVLPQGTSSLLLQDLKRLEPPHDSSYAQWWAVNKPKGTTTAMP